MLTAASSFGQGAARYRALMLPLRDENPTRRTAWMTVLLIVANVGVYFLLQPGSTDPTATSFTYENAAIPCEVVTGEPLSITEITERSDCERGDAFPQPFPDKGVYRSVVVSMFLHGSFMHLAGNMLFLWVFGNNIEDHLGVVRYLLFYLAAGVVATLAHIAIQPDSTIPLIGASGAIAGVMGAYLVWYPRAPVLALVFIVLTHVPAWLLLGLWFVTQFQINPNDGVAWMAHVGGFVFGVLFGLLTRSRRAVTPAF